MSKTTILLVDDSPTNLHVLLNYLKNTGFETLIAQSGESALRQIKEVKLCASSFFMPETSGKSTVAMALEICHGNSATATAIA